MNLWCIFTLLILHTTSALFFARPQTRPKPQYITNNIPGRAPNKFRPNVYQNSWTPGSTYGAPNPSLPRPTYEPPTLLPPLPKPTIPIRLPNIAFRPINLNLLGLLGNKIARIIALKRGLLGGVISLIPFQRPRPGGVKPCYKTCYEPSPPVVPITTPPPILTSTPHPSYLAPGYYNPPTTTTRYHTNVGSVIKVVDDGDNDSGARFPSGGRPNVRPTPNLIDSYGAPVTASYNNNNDDSSSGVIVVGRENPPTVIGIKSPKLNDNRPKYYDFVPPPPPTAPKQPKFDDPVPVNDILDSYGAPVSRTPFIPVYDEESSPEPSVSDSTNDGFQSVHNQWIPMLGVDFNDDDNEARGSYRQPTDYETVDYKNEARDSLEQTVDSTTILNHLFVNKEEQSGSNKEFTLDSPPSFDELDQISYDNVQNSIDDVVNCIKKLTNNSDDEGSDCTRDLTKTTNTRESKENKDINNDESVSFILSIEPVNENVKELVNNEFDIEPRNPKAIFVMLPNFDVNELNEETIAADKNFNSDSNSDAGNGRNIIDGFVIDNTAEGVDISDDNNDDKDYDTEDQDAGSGATRGNHP